MFYALFSSERMSDLLWVFVGVLFATSLVPISMVFCMLAEMITVDVQHLTTADTIARD